MSLKLHWSPDSANLVVRVALEVLGLDYESIRIDRSAKDHRSPEYLKKNPQGLIPVLEDGEIVLFETGAILWHLAEKTGRLGPDGPRMDEPTARAAALKWIFYLSNTIHADMRVAFYTHRWIKADLVDDLREGVAHRLTKHFDLIEGQLEQGGLLGSEITLPDLYALILSRWLRIFPFGAPCVADLGAWPRLNALAERAEAMPALRRAFAAESIAPDQALTRPARADLPLAEITG